MNPREDDRETFEKVECEWCYAEVDELEDDAIPDDNDDEAWENLALDHADDCEWVRTRSFTREFNSSP